ncbi:MAG: hypothetical protein OXI47_06820 [Gammaproteobacteria bacterium]|nr:hypothetical protein [Gammaproteobacteria bacterium]
MARRAVSTLISVAAGVLVFSVAAGQGSRSPELIGLATIPGASELGWVEVMRQSDTGDAGWHCKTAGGHLYALERLREGRARVPPDVAEKGWQAIFNYEARHGGLPAVAGTLWERALGIFLIQRLTFLSENGRPAFRTPKPSLTWRGWLRQTLEEINEKADRKGMSAARRRRALGNWVMCHISEVHAERVRQGIYDNSEKASNQ